MRDMCLTFSFDDPPVTAAPMRHDLEKVLIIGCGALAREILDVIALNKWDHVTLTCLPAQLHMQPEKIPEAVREAIVKGRKSHRHIFVAYADCGTGGLLDKVIAEEGVARIDGPHCYSFYSGNAAFSAIAEDEITAFYLTDFLARQFDSMILKSLGIDKHPELAEMYFGNYEKLVYLAQVEDPALQDKARDAAERLGLAYEYRFTGYGDLADALSQPVRARQTEATPAS